MNPLSSSLSFTQQNYCLKNSLPSNKLYFVYSIFKVIKDYSCLIKINSTEKQHKEVTVRLLTQSHLEKKNLSPFRFNDLLSHYFSYLKNDVNFPLDLVNCFQALENDFQFLRNVTARLIETKQINSYLETKLNEFKELKSDESRIIFFNRTSEFPDGELAFIINRNENNCYNLRLLGSSTAMKAVGAQVISKHEKSKIQSEVVFENIPIDNFLNIFDKNCLLKWVKNENFDAKEMCFKKLEAYQQLVELSAEEPEVNLTTVSDQVQKLFWNVINSSIKIVSNHSKDENKKIRLRAELASFFEIFKREKESLLIGTDSYYRITTMHQKLSAKLLNAYQKGWITEQDIKDISIELDIIATTLQKAKKNPSPTNFSSIILESLFFYLVDSAKWSVDPIYYLLSYKNKNLNFPNRHEGIRPTYSLPLQEFAIPSLSVYPYTDITTKTAFLSAFREKINEWEKTKDKKEEQALIREEIFHLITKIPFDPLINETGNKRKNENSFWWTLSKDEAQEIVDKIYAFCFAVVREKDIQEHKTQFQYESILKSTMIVIFLRNYYLGLRNSSSVHHYFSRFEVDSAALQWQSQCSIQKMKYPRHNFRQINALSFKIHLETAVNWAGLYNDRSLNSLPTYDRQDDEPMIKDVLQWLHGYLPEKPFYLPSEKELWLRPFTHPFLVALHRQVASFIWKCPHTEIDFNSKKAATPARN